MLSSSIYAQNNIQFTINHQLSDVDFEFNMGTKNNIDHDFNVTRLQYYISEISIIHDGGTETAIQDKWILVNANQPTQVDLGDHDVTAVEGVHFHIGVNEAVNHADPASYPAGHPLAPVFPSMHWGWAAGYRFVAIEGFGSSDYNQLYQLHGLEDDNYFKTEVPLMTTAENDTVSINIDGDYTRILEDIEVNSGVIAHGGFGAAKKALENFRDYVFTASSGSTATVDFSEITNFNIYPNPTANGSAALSISADKDLSYEVSINDVMGRQVQYFDNVQSNSVHDIYVEQPGVYVVNLIKNGQVVITRKLVK